MCSWDLVSSVCLPPGMGKSATDACKPGLVCFTSVSQIQMKQFKVSCSGLTCESFGPVQRESQRIWGVGVWPRFPPPIPCRAQTLLRGKTFAVWWESVAPPGTSPATGTWSGAEFTPSRLRKYPTDRKLQISGLLHC